jgi:hypothetical protein
MTIPVNVTKRRVTRVALQSILEPLQIFAEVIAEVRTI